MLSKFLDISVFGYLLSGFLGMNYENIEGRRKVSHIFCRGAEQDLTPKI